MNGASTQMLATDSWYVGWYLAVHSADWQVSASGLLPLLELLLHYEQPPTLHHCLLPTPQYFS